MANKVDVNKNEHTYNPDVPFVQRPENLGKTKRKAKSK
jgi:hypothetical protein